MMGFPLVENVRGFFVSRPPLVMFMICLGSFAVALITFAYIIKMKDMPNPDIKEDWNDFLDRLASVDFCVVSPPGDLSTVNATHALLAGEKLRHALDRVPSRLQEIMGPDRTRQQRDMPTVASSTATVPAAEHLVNVSVLIDVEMHALKTLVTIAASNNFTSISTVLHGDQIGFTGNQRAMEANVTLVLPPLGNLTTHCLNGAHCYKVTACATIIAPAGFFPRTKRPDFEQRCERDPEGWNNHLHLEVTTDWRQCLNASFLHLIHQYDPTLTIMLTMQDRSVINLHLMHTSYFLFVMMVTLFCYAIIKGRPNKVKIVYTQCATDKSNPA